MTWLWKRLSNSGAETTVSGRALRRFPDRDIDHLLRAGVLTEQRKADCWAICEHCDCGLDARPIREIGDAFHACCPHDATQDVILTEDDLLRFSIDSDKLVGAIAASGGLNDLEPLSECSQGPSSGEAAAIGAAVAMLAAHVTLLDLSFRLPKASPILVLLPEGQ